MQINLDHLGIEVPELEPVRRFYENVLGMKAVREMAPGGRVRKIVFLQGQGFTLEFLEVPGIQVAPSFHISFGVPGVTQAVETLRAAGLLQPEPIKEAPPGPDGATRVRVTFIGPAGEKLELMGPE